jgi:hypothetical protein
MSFTNNGLTTGLLGYKLRKEFLGVGLFYRETEVYNWKIYSRAGAGTNYSGIETYIKNAFASYSGDVRVKQLDTPADYQFPNDHLRVAEFNVEIEIRRPITGVSGIADFNPELTTNRYKGLDQNFFTSYATYFDSFGEDFTFESRDDGSSVFIHNVNFSLTSGGKPKAQEIISGIFSNDKDTTLGINVLSNGVVIANTGLYQNYFNESYDLFRNTFSFSRKREILPSSGQPYLYDLSHSIVYKNNGLIDVSEKAKINGRISFGQAQDGYVALYASAFTRCNTKFNDFSSLVAGAGVTDSLVNLPITSSRTLNKLGNLVEYEISFSNDPNLNTNNNTTREKTTEIQRDEQGFITINQNYNYTSLVVPISGGSDARYVTILQQADSESANEVVGIYTTGPFFDARRPTINRVRLSAATPNRKKQFNIAMSYSNNPIYFVTLNSITFAVLEFSVSDAKPSDMVTEYKIINRPDKRSILNYAYQTERGTKTVNISARLQRSAANMFSSPRSSIAAELYSVYKYAIGKAMETFNGNSFIALSYYLSDLRYGLSSDNELTMEIAITYAIKKYLA